MTPACTAGYWTRIALAMAFGFMSLGHGPIMTFAHAAKHETAPHAAAHHHGDATHQHHAPDAGDQAPAAHQPQACNAFGCFITVGAISIEPPAQAMMPIGKLVPPMAPAALPVFTEPTDPPPRLCG